MGLPLVNNNVNNGCLRSNARLFGYHTRYRSIVAVAIPDIVYQTEETDLLLKHHNVATSLSLEIAVNEEFVERTIEAILKGAKTGRIGDGKFLFTTLEECVRIRTEERGSVAIG